MASARVRLPSDLDGLMRSEMLRCIEESNLGQNDTTVAKRYLIDQWAQIDIAAELGWGKSTVSVRMPRILQKVQATARKLNMV
jgi:DNA-directed RNA polymerase specialized sigma24 family protein